MQIILKEYTVDDNISSFRYSSLAICYKSTILVSCHQKNDRILIFFQVFKQTYSGEVITVVLMCRKIYRKCFIFYEKLETLNAREKVDIILEHFHLNSQDPQVFQDVSGV